LKLYKKIIIYVSISLSLTILLFIVVGGFNYESIQELYSCLCDSFCVSGMLTLCASALIWVSNEGIFDGVGFTFSNFFKLRSRSYELKKETYSEYKDRKHPKDKKISAIKELLITGLSLLAIGLVFLILYHSI